MMKIFDFNIHLPILDEHSVDSMIANERELGIDGVLNGLNYHRGKLIRLDGYNIMLFNESLLIEADRILEITAILGSKNSLLTLLFDFRADNCLELVDLAYDSGIRSIKFHSYVQNIADSDFNKIVEVAMRASSKEMLVCVDASYGSIKMYKYDNLKLVCAIAEKVTKTPIIVLHSGGARVFDAMLIADERKNIFLETSFSLTYYKGSSIELDLAFAYKKIGADRLLYGSDFPYIDLDSSIENHLVFFEKHQFSSQDIEAVMYSNRHRLI